MEEPVLKRLVLWLIRGVEGLHFMEEEEVSAPFSVAFLLLENFKAR